MSEEVADSERALLQCFCKSLKIPDDVKEELERGADQRAYIKDCMLRTEGASVVSTNYVYRYLTASLADLFPREPQFAVRPRDKMWGPEGPPPEIYAFGTTMQSLLNFKAGRSFTNFSRAIAREALTVASVWGKLIWHEDYTRDPIGVKHSTDFDRVVARYTSMYRQYKAKDFDKDSAKYEELRSLSEAVKQTRLDEIDETLAQDPVDPEFADLDPRVIEARRIAGKTLVDPDDLPEVPVYQEFMFDLVEQEDIRWDWNIKRYENWMDCEYIQHRVRMTVDDVVQKYGVDEKDFKLRETEGNVEEDTQEHRNDIENNHSANTIDVWERWDRALGRVFVFCEELDSFLDSYEPMTWSGFYMLFPLQFNPVAGEFLGISDVDMMRSLQDEINEKRTNGREYISAAMPRFAVSADAFDDSNDLQTIAGSAPFSYVPIKSVEDPNTKIFTFQAPPVDPSFFNPALAVSELEVMAARPTSALGGANPGVTATQTAFSNEQLGGQVAQRRKVFEDYLTLIGSAMIEILLQTMDPLEVQAVCGPVAFWPQDDRQAMLTELDLEVSTNLDNLPNGDQFMERLMGLHQLALSMGRIPNPDLILPKLAREVLKLDIPVEAWYPATPQMLPGMGTPGPAPGAGAGEPGPSQQGGTPTMSQLPGNAQTAQNAART